jgi:uncharacterized membrane-anchored protein
MTTRAKLDASALVLALFALVNGIFAYIHAALGLNGLLAGDPSPTHFLISTGNIVAATVCVGVAVYLQNRVNTLAR